MSLTQPVASALAGTQIGRYTLLGKLAVGGMAEVFLARQAGPMGFAKTVVIKRILPEHVGDREFLQMFLDEARLAALINHPHVVQIFELGEDPENQSFFIAMEYIDGRNLKQVATRALELGSQISMRVSARIISDAAAGLEFAHSLKDAHAEPLHIVHRDISAENLLMSYGGMVKVVDFGIAKAAHLEGRTRTGHVKGKFGYMAPEQLLGQPSDRRVDVWALGITLYWLLSGKRPFRGESEGRIIQQVISAELPALERRGTPIAQDLEEIVRTCLEKDPARRFQTAGELQEALEHWIVTNGEPVGPAVLSGLMEQLFPEQTDKDRLLTRALLQGEIQAQDTPWQARLHGQPEIDSELSQLPPKKPASWLLPAGGAALSAVALAVGIYGWQALSGDADPLPPVIDRTPLPALPDTTAEGVPDDRPPAPTVPQPALGQATTQPLPSLAPAPAPAAPQDRPAIPLARATDLPARRDHHPPVPHSHKPLPASPEVHEEKHSVTGPPGLLDVETRPWASVIVDGRRVGTTPMAPVSVPAGKHRVELVNEDLGAHLVRTVEVKSGETALLREKILAGAGE